MGRKHRRMDVALSKPRKRKANLRNAYLLSREDSGTRKLRDYEARRFARDGIPSFQPWRLHLYLDGVR